MTPPPVPADHVALVTCAEWPDLTPDDRLLAAALERRGFHPVPAKWDAPGVAWAEHRAVVVRSCWDYHHRAAHFERWLDRLEREGARVINPVPTLRWNMRKSYLRDLEAAGVHVAHTFWAPMGSGVTLREVADSTGWTEMVVKPLVSASGHETWRVERAGVDGAEARFARLLGERDLMVQPFIPAFVTHGELSLVFLGGRYSHAVRKRAKAGDFRVQEEHGGTAEREDVAPDLGRQAARVVAAAPLAEPPLYARVDGVVLNGRLTVTELELIEPLLYLAWDVAAADRLAEALARALG